MNRKTLKKTEWGIIICVLLLTFIGFIELYSTTKNSGYEDFRKQLIWFSISIVMMILCIKIDYNTLARFSPFLYGGSIILLIIVLIFADVVNGARSWIGLGFFSFQPGEFSKICVILFLSYSIVKICKKEKDINKPLKLLLIIPIVFVPVILIALEPDYGTAISYVVALILILFVSGINKKYIISALLIIAILIPLLYFFILPQHAVDRINVYLNPNSDPRGAGYNIIQSKLAVGAGQLFGMGWRKRNTNSARIFISKNNRLYFFCIGRRIWLLCMWNSCYIVCNINYESN